MLKVLIMRALRSNEDDEKNVTCIIIESVS